MNAALPMTTGTLGHARRAVRVCRVCGHRRRVVRLGDVVSKLELVAGAARGSAIARRLDDRDASRIIEGSAVVDGRRWAELDLCERCHGPAHPTRKQLCEIGRLEAAKGSVRLLRAARPGDLVVIMTAQGADPAAGLAGVLPPSVTLSAGGRVVGHSTSKPLDAAPRARPRRREAPMFPDRNRGSL